MGFIYLNKCLLPGCPRPLTGDRARDRRLLLSIPEFRSIENAMPSAYHFAASPIPTTRTDSAAHKVHGFGGWGEMTPNHLPVVSAIRPVAPDDRRRRRAAVCPTRRLSPKRRNGLGRAAFARRMQFARRRRAWCGSGRGPQGRSPPGLRLPGMSSVPAGPGNERPATAVEAVGHGMRSIMPRVIEIVWHPPDGCR